MGVSKKQAQRRHAKQRARERLGIRLNKQAYRQLVAQIQDQKAQFVERQSNRVTVWEVEHEGTPFVALYDSSRKTIVTVFPEGTTVEPDLLRRLQNDD